MWNPLCSSLHWDWNKCQCMKNCRHEELMGFPLYKSNRLDLLWRFLTQSMFVLPRYYNDCVHALYNVIVIRQDCKNNQRHSDFFGGGVICWDNTSQKHSQHSNTDTALASKWWKNSVGKAYSWKSQGLMYHISLLRTHAKPFSTL